MSKPANEVAREWLFRSDIIDAFARLAQSGNGQFIIALAELITSEREQIREAAAGACREIVKDAERSAIKWHEHRNDGARNMEARFIHQSVGAANCEKAIRTMEIT